jgi:hypothetical protein
MSAEPLRLTPKGALLLLTAQQPKSRLADTAKLTGEERLAKASLFGARWGRTLGSDFAASRNEATVGCLKGRLQ